MNEKKYSNVELGYSLRLGTFSRQADGAVWLTKGETVVHVVAVKEESKDFPGFFPLSVDHRELFSSAGKIPGGYFKREGKPTDKEVLLARVIDRTLRPLFPASYFDKIAITSTVYSIDKDNLPTSMALIAASLALGISNIPFMGPAGCCEVTRVNGQWFTDPTHDQNEASDARIIVAGTYEGINMVEGHSVGISEEELLDALFLAHGEIKKQIEWQRSIIEEYAPGERKVKDTFNVLEWKKEAYNFLTKDRVEKLFQEDKIVRTNNRDELWNEFIVPHKEKIEKEKISESIIGYAFNFVLQEKISDLVIDGNKRIDGRSFDKVRAISSEVGLLPKAHGSALFTRGRTQLLATITLGGSGDESKIETLIPEVDAPFMLHYNFLPSSVGEARPVRAPGRREIGHGYLAANAVKAVLPTRNEFPYSMRIVADVLESDGSTSMATVCSSILSLMDAGVPIKNMVAGTAMGMLKKQNDNNFVIVTDIAGIEDELGLMDFKIAGTENHVTAVQMDIKYKGGLEKDVFKNALEKAKQARLHILSKMKETMTEPRKKLSSLVPQFHVLKIPKDKIGAVIGSGGKVIKEITEKTQTTINIEDDGTVKIFGMLGENFERAIAWVKGISGDIAIGTKIHGTIKKHAEFGTFVEVFPGVDGLVHVSSIPKNEQATFKNKHKEGSKIDVVVIEHDQQSGRIRLKLVE